MKLIVLVCFISTSVMAGIFDGSTRINVDPKEGTYTYIEATSASKADAFSSVVEWTAKKYVSAPHVTMSSDREAGFIAIKAIMPIRVAGSTQDCQYSLNIKVKDNKIKIEFITGCLINTNYYPPKNEMLKIKSHASQIKSELLQIINNNDF